METNILITGASGLLGHQVFLEAKKRHGDSAYGIYRTSRKELAGMVNLRRIDLMDAIPLKAMLRELRPRWVINCAGIVKKHCVNPHEAIVINAALPHLIKDTLAEWGGRLIQVSTDCIFSGKKGRYTEQDLADADDLYGKSKLLGEVSEAPHLTVRTSFIGKELGTANGLLEWFLKQKGPVQGFRRVIWSGLTSDRAAAILIDLAENPRITGILNLCSSPIDKYSLLRLMAEVFKRDSVMIESVDVPIKDLSLDGTRLKSLGISVPPIRDMLVQLSGLKT